MAMNRREFIKDFGTKSAGVAAGATAFVAAQADALKKDVADLGQGLDAKLSAATADIKNHMGQLSSRMDKAALRLAHQQVQLYFIFLLIAISFAIDAGMSSAMFIGAI